MLSAREVIAKRRTDILALAVRHGARRVRIFGSVARDEAVESSDIDFLVELEPGARSWTRWLCNKTSANCSGVVSTWSLRAD